MAEDAKFASLRELPPKTIYFPVSEETMRGNLVFLMNSESKKDAISAYRKALREMAPSIPLVLFATMQEQMDAALGPERLITGMSASFAGLALFLSAVGLYSLLSSMVAQRTAEIGVRIALGAGRNSVLGMVLSEAAQMLGAGVVMGAVALPFALRFVEKMFYEVRATDTLAVVGALTILAAVAVLASFLPAFRAASLDPMRALRVE